MADSKINQKNKKESNTEQANFQKLKCDHTEEEESITEQKFLSGQYPDLATMATDINGGVPVQGD